MAWSLLASLRHLLGWASRHLTFWQALRAAVNPAYALTTASAARRMTGLNEMGIPCFEPLALEDLLKHHRRYKARFGKPLPLAIKGGVSLVTCMDARLMPATMFGFDLGDCEYIRNAGGRVTEDVIRSLVITNELLNTRLILVIHHTDCGAQAAHKHEARLARKVREKYGQELPPLRGFPDSPEGLLASVREDVQKLVECPLIDPTIPIHGFVYDTKDASLTEVATRR